jgi:hypothetical protein
MITYTLCWLCDGSGYIRETGKTCPICNGKGQIPVKSSLIFGIVTYLTTYPKMSKKKKPAVSSKLQNLPTLDWGNADRNHKNLKRLEKAIQDEHEAKKEPAVISLMI